MLIYSKDRIWQIEGNIIHNDIILEIKKVSKYNIWFQVTLGDEEFPPLLLIRKNELLPYINNKIIYSEDQNIQQYVLTVCDFEFCLSVKYCLSIGEGNLEEARKYKEEFSLLCKVGSSKIGYRGRELKAIASKKTLFEIEDKVTLALKIVMKENQEWNMTGLILADKHEDTRFHKTIHLD